MDRTKLYAVLTVTGSSRDSQITRQLGSLSELLCVQADITPSHMVTEARVVAELV